MKKIKVLAVVSMLIPFQLHATELSGIIQSSLQYLSSAQTTGHEGYDPGQWKAEVTSTVPGVGKLGVSYEEPTAFVAASVANILAEIHQMDPKLTQIQPMLDKTQTGLAPYRYGSVFHFYPPKTYQGLNIRGPRFMYITDSLQGFSNTPPDADTSSVTFLYLNYENPNNRVPSQALATFAKFRDTNRDPHMYDSMHGYKDTGAYLTWLFDESDPKMPKSIFDPPQMGTRIPFGKNDVDCVVNTNVLKMLTATHNTQTKGYAETCNYLNEVSAQKQYYHCGQYYPSTYAYPYAMATAINMGVSCLKPGKDAVLEEILNSQNPIGYWINDVEARPDWVQSTAWAVSTLMMLGNPNDARQSQAVSKGIEFLLQQAQSDAHGHYYWQGEVFYAAIFLVRYPIVWRSDSYTTATVVKALELAKSKWHLNFAL